MIELGLLPFLVGLEIMLLLLVAAVVMTLRSLALSRRLRELEDGASGGVRAESVSYETFLRDELRKTRTLLEQHGKEGEPPAWLLARRRFLELELDARAVAGDPLAFQERLDNGFQVLLDQCRPLPEPEPETEADPEPEPLPEPEPENEDVQLAEEVLPDADAGKAKANARVSDDELHQKEVGRLRDLIGHQQDAMRTLRTELESRSGEIDELEAIVAQLDAFEAQTAELMRCIGVLESENERLKQAHADGVATGVGSNPEELGRLKDMVNDQQSTIGTLQGMLEQLRPEAGKAHELEDTLNDVLKSNKELNTCIMVLEDENQSLRDQLNTLEDQSAAPGGDDREDIAAFQQRIQELEGLLEFKDATLEQLEQDIEKLRAGATGGGEGGAADEELEIKVQELEALLEFKEAAIEELEKQYAELEAKYLALSESELPSN